MRPWFAKELSPRAFLLFQRLQRFYNTFIILAALVAGLAISALTFPEFHQSVTRLSEISEGFLCSAAITAVVSTVVATMLLFLFEGFDKANRLDYVVAWTPLILLDLSIIELLVGLVCWYSSVQDQWRVIVMAAQLASQLGFCAALSVWMWARLSRKHGLDGEERERLDAGGQVVVPSVDASTTGLPPMKRETLIATKKDTAVVEKGE